MQDFFRRLLEAALALLTAMAPPSHYTSTHLSRLTPVSFASHERGAAIAAPVLTAAEASASDTLPREQCLTISLGLRAASECGDLRLAHALPSVRTYGRDRAPVLVYNSDHANPHPLVAANVALDRTGLTRVTARVLVNGIARGARSWMASEWPTTGAARIALPYDASGDVTNLYPYTLEVTAFYDARSVTSRLKSRLAVVNRASSPFGAGWWVAGLERLYLDAYGRPGMWVGGDGSVRRYVTVRGDTTHFTAPTVDRPDTLRRIIGGFERILGGGVRVQFDAAGRHVRTINRQNHETVFAYDTDGRLRTLTVPPATAGASYTFNYRTSGTLASVTLAAGGSGESPMTRTMNLGHTGQLLESITDAMGFTTRFGYAGASSGRVRNRTDRSRTVTYFRFNDSSFKVIGAMTEVRENGALVDSIASVIDPAEQQGVSLPRNASQVATVLDGPRRDLVDTTRFFLTRYGAPREIHDALGHVTQLQHDIARPGLVIQLIAPNQTVTDASYDARGNPNRVIEQNPYGDGRSAVTDYTWDQRWDQMTQMISPMRDTTTFIVSQLNGEILSQYTGDSTRRVDVTYYDAGIHAGLVRSMRLPTGETDEYRYDERRGNLRYARTPMGFVSLTLGNALGQDPLQLTPVEASQSDSAGTAQTGNRIRLAYDALGRVREQWSESAPRPGTVDVTPEIIHVVNAFDAEGRPISVRRDVTPDYNLLGVIEDQWTYDAAGRQTAMSGASRTMSFRYDPAGNVRWTSAGDSSQYDALNRRVAHLLPRVDAPLNNGGGFYEDSTGAVADVERYEYDVMGNMLVADNAAARVRRAYYPNGALKADTLSIRNYGDQSYHVSPIAYEYDLDARVTAMHHREWSGESGALGTVVYAYEAGTGNLSSVTDPANHLFRYSYDLSNRETGRRGPGTSADTMRYDADSRLSARAVGETLTRDARGKLLSRTDGTAQGAYTFRYSPLGNLREMTKGLGSSLVHTERYRPDPLGNADSVTIENSPTAPGVDGVRQLVRAYDQGRGSFAGARRYVGENGFTGWLPDNDSQYNDLGNLTSELSFAYVTGQPVPDCGNTRNCTDTATDVTTRRMFYDANQRMRFLVSSATQHFHGDSSRATSTEFRYDALGRRVLVRYRGPANCAQENTPECRSTLDHQLWAGAQLLAETRETDVPFAGTISPGFAGRVAYTPGRGIDEPLSMHRTSPLCDFTVFPHANFLGQLASGTFEEPKPSCAYVAWAGSEGLPYRNTSTYLRNEPWNGSLADLQGGNANGLQYLRNRYYNPASGQFTQADPIGVAGGLNTFGYADGDPVMYSDPFGLFAADCDYKTGKGCSPGYQQQLRDDRPIEDVSAETYALMSLGTGFVRGTLVAGTTALRNSIRASSTVIGRKAIGDMARRGWTEAIVRSTVRNPVGIARGTEAATGEATTYFFRAEGSFVVRNDATRVIIQVSDRRSAEAIANFIPMIVP
ncbi:MAG: hypothetical protein H0W68_00030 [Gemmatimonadaceae bacterium]|nr:hypothetical protein [Gemmatimonadaceae bacterium]